MCDPVGIVEIADRLEVSRHTVHKWRQRRVMPEPRWTVGGGPCWDWPDVQVWAFHSRRRGRGSNRAGSLKPVEGVTLDISEVCPSCGRLIAITSDGALVAHELTPGRVRHDGSTLCPGAP